MTTDDTALSPNSTMPTSPWSPQQTRDVPFSRIPLCRLPRNFPIRKSFGEVGIMEFRLQGMSRVCSRRHICWHSGIWALHNTSTTYNNQLSRLSTLYSWHTPSIPCQFRRVSMQLNEPSIYAATFVTNACIPHASIATKTWRRKYIISYIYLKLMHMTSL